MYISKQVSSALVLGSILVSTSPAWAGEGGDDRVQLIEFPADSNVEGNVCFSGDGEVSCLYRSFVSGSDIYRYEDNEWILIRREYSYGAPGMFPSDVSSDGSYLVLMDGYVVDVIHDATTYSMPHEWTYTDVDQDGDPFTRYVAGAAVGQGRISGDGQVVTMLGRDHQQSKTSSLVWNGGPELINISDGLPASSSITYHEGMPSADGSVIAFQSTTPYPQSDVWVWQDGVRSEIPRLDPTADGYRSLIAVSGSGRVIFGSDSRLGGRGPLRCAHHDHPNGSCPTSGLSGMWMWTEQDGTVPIMISSGFSSIWITDINYDGTLAFGEAQNHQREPWKRFLWYGENKFILVDDLLTSLGVSIRADWYELYDLSDDGTKLMGTAVINGRYHALIITIPDLTP